MVNNRQIHLAGLVETRSVHSAVIDIYGCLVEISSVMDVPLKSVLYIQLSWPLKSVLYIQLSWPFG